MSERKVAEKARKPRASAGTGTGGGASKSRKKKAAASDSEEERDAEGVAAGGGVGSLVLERKSKGGSKKKKTTPSKRKKGADDSEAESDAEEEDGGKKKKKAKKGASSVDASKENLSRTERLHEEYMQLKVDDLKKILGINNMSMPGKPQNKDRLAWQCVFGEVLGAPAQLCTRCGKGKLKPKVKGEFALADVKKGVTKWTCPGYFDDELDSIAFCNKAYTDKEIKTVPFKGKGHVTAEDEAALAERKAKAAVEREAARERRAEAGLDDESSRASSPSGTPKKRKFVHAPSLEQRAAAAAAAGSATGSAVGSEAEDEGEDVAASADVGMGVVELANDPAFAAFVSDPVAALVTAPRTSSDQRAGHGAGADAGAGAGAGVAHADRPLCKYEPDCYRNNPDHLSHFAHPVREQKEAATAAATAAANAKEEADAKQADEEAEAETEE